MMNQVSDNRSRQLLVSMRKIIQAIDVYSRTLNKKFGLTGPQLVILHEIADHGRISITPLAAATSLRQSTVTDITQRLEAKGYICRHKTDDDKRVVSLALTPEGMEMIKNLPPMLQDEFTQRFSSIPEWEQKMILSAFERTVELMSAKQMDASPVLVTGPINPK